MNKEEKVTLIDAFKDFKEEKNIDRPVMMGVLKDVFLTQIAKTYGSADNFDVIVNVDKGTCEIYQNFEIVEEVENPAAEMTLEEVRKDSGDDDYEIGDTYAKKLPLAAFGRRGILNIRQNLQGRIMDIEKANVYKKYSEKVGEVFTGEIYQTWSREVLLLDEDGNELLLPKAEQIPGDFFRKGEPARAVVARVDNSTGNPKIILSRTSPVFLQRLLENEVPEIAEGLIAIRKIVRVPGERAKIAVESFDDRIDPVGACVGVRGSRVHGIVRELRNENLDVIQWTNNLQLLIARALGPAEINTINLDPLTKHCEVYLNPDQVSLAIGKGGLNIRLASMLTETTIDVYRELPEGEPDEMEDDIHLDDFKDEIDEWVIEELKKNGWTTARSVLEAPREMLIQKADLEEETVDEIIRILQQEFADDDVNSTPATPTEPSEPSEEAAPETPAADTAPDTAPEPQTDANSEG